MSICKACGQECHVVTVDNGIGYVEWWGAPSWHHDYVQVSNCCEAPIWEPSEYISENDMEWSGV